jgi:hypothetical protein
MAQLLLNAMMRLAHSEMFNRAKWLRTSGAVVWFIWIVVITSPVRVHSWQTNRNWNDAAAGFIGKTLVRAGQPSAVSFSLSNASSFSSNEVNEVRRALESQLVARGARIVKQEQAIADLRIILSENVAALIWIAEIRTGSKRDVVMMDVARNETLDSAQPSPALVLHKESVWSQYEPILDFAIWENRSRLLVLGPRTVSSYRMNNSKWTFEQSQSIPRLGPAPMDIRGRLLMRDRKFEAFVPGEHCTGALDAGLTLECRQTDDPWPLAGENSPRAFFSATRNFFTGVLTGVNPQRSPAPFFSAANVQSAGRNVWIFAGTDGRVRQSEAGEGDLRLAWGSTITGVKSGCASGWQVLATGLGDWSQRDLLQAFELGDGVVPVTSAVEVAGPVTALWPAADGSSAQVVARNVGSGKYEAFSFSISCR